MIFNKYKNYRCLEWKRGEENNCVKIRIRGMFFFNFTNCILFPIILVWQIVVYRPLVVHFFVSWETGSLETTTRSGRPLEHSIDWLLPMYFMEIRT